MQLDRWNKMWQGLRQYVINKYVITFLVFAFVMIFLGDQSLVRRFRRAMQIRELQEQRDEYLRGIEEAEQEIKTLQNKDSLERYARENYYMHSVDEDVYVIQ